MTETLDVRAVRRLALARAGLLACEANGLPSRARGAGPSARDAAHTVIGRFGYLQLDTISVAGARSHSLVLASRLDGLDASLGERLLAPGAPLFEYWGHAVSWMPLALYPLFEFRRRRFRRHPWWGDVIADNRSAADALLRRARDDGPFRSSDLEGEGGKGWWRIKESKRVAEALWSAGDLAIRERRGFQRTYDLTERVIPAELRDRLASLDESMRALVLLALDGHGWAEERTIAATWNLRRTRPEFVAAIRSLAEDGEIVPCALRDGDTQRAGWIRPRDLETASRVARLRPRGDRGVLLTPFDPLLWDRARVRRLFGFDVVLEIYVPASKRRYGYFCMPVLAGERLVARVDVKADRAAGRLRVVACHYEDGETPAAREAVRTAVARHARAVGLPAQ
jgi:uncharacterized protein YcaQ